MRYTLAPLPNSGLQVSQRVRDAITTFGPPEWCNRHHVVPSKGNSALPKGKRAYFDVTPVGVQVKGGEFNSVLVFQAQDHDVLDGFEARLRHRRLEFPSSSPPGGRRARRAWAPGDAEPSGLGTQAPHVPGPPGSSPSCARSTPSPAASSPGGPAAASHAAAGAGPRAGDARGAAPAESAAPDIRHSSREAPRRASSSSGPGWGRPRPCGYEAEGPAPHEPSPPDAVGEVPAAAEYMNFVDWCRSNYSDPVCLWRKLDKDASMSLIKREFTMGLRELRYRGNLEVLWAFMDRDHTGILSFLEFAPEVALDLAQLRHWAQEKYGGTQALFQRLDKDRNGSLTLAEFSRGCAEGGLPEPLRASLGALFRLLDAAPGGPGQGALTGDELAFLDRWKCPAYLFARPDPGSLRRFRGALLRRHGMNPLLAWRRDLDQDGSMRVNYCEFIAAVGRLARSGVVEIDPAADVATLYCALDQDKSGWFTLRDWDEEAHRLLFQFQRWAKNKYGRVSQCGKGMEDNPKEGVGLKHFRRGTKDLRLSSDEKALLFEGLSLQRSLSGTISPSEVWFLDCWDPDLEAQDDLAWARVAATRLSLRPAAEAARSSPEPSP